MEEYGHVVLLGLFDCVDDTVLVRKSILSTLVDNIDQIAEDKYGAKVLLYLLAPRNPKYFAPDVVALLKQGDSNPHSKKDAATRSAELLEGIKDAAHETVRRNCATLMQSDGAHCLLVDAILRVEGPGLAEAMASVAQYVADVPRIMEHPAIHRVLKNLVRSNVGDFAFARALLGNLAGSLAKHARVNRSAFVLLSLVESGCADVAAAVRKELAPALPELRKIQGVAGTDLLCKVVAGEKIEAKAPASKKRSADEAQAPAAPAAPAADAEDDTDAQPAPPAAKTQAKTPAKTPAKASANKTPAAKSTGRKKAKADEDDAQDPAPAAAAPVEPEADTDAPADAMTPADAVTPAPKKGKAARTPATGRKAEDAAPVTPAPPSFISPPLSRRLRSAKK